MANTIRLKRRAAPGATGAPSALASGELAFNENDLILYYGKGDNGSGVATTVISIAGSGAYALLAADQTFQGAVAFSQTISGNISGNAATATVLAASRTIALGTDLSGSAAFNGSSNITISATIANSAVTTAKLADGAVTMVKLDIASAASIAPDSADSLPLYDVSGGVNGRVTIAALTSLITAGVGTGTVTSVGLSLPAEFSVTGSPVTSSGTLTAAWTSQTANYVLAAPGGSSGTPTFRLLVAADIPSLTAAKISNFDTQVRTSRLDQLAAPTASVSLNSQKITNLLDPTAAQDAATKAYVDNIASGLDVKASCRVATTANITLSGTQTIDGVAVIAGDRVLVKDQATGSQNGIWVVAAGAWSRASDADASAEVTAGMYTFIEEGTANADSGWILTTDNPITLGTTALVFTQFSGAGQITAGNGLTKSGNTLNVVGTAGRISVAADSIDIDSGYVGQASITTLGTIGTGTWQGTTVAVAYGGTGAATAASARTNLGLGTMATQNASAVAITGGTIDGCTIDGGTF